MRRVRKVLDRASQGKKFAPLVDIHTGNIGPDSPSAVTYLSHFPYADSAWNGEGTPMINWDDLYHCLRAEPSVAVNKLLTSTGLCCLPCFAIIHMQASTGQAILRTG